MGSNYALVDCRHGAGGASKTAYFQKGHDMVTKANAKTDKEAAPVEKAAPVKKVAPAKKAKKAPVKAKK